MLRIRRMLAMLLLGVPVLSAWAAAPSGLLAEWNFDEGQGDVARDSSGNGHDARLEGATWAKQGDGFALSLDGLDDCVDCGSSKAIGINGPVTVEAWVKPTRKANGEACLFGESYSSYLITYYNTEICCWYIGDGGNNVYGKVTLNGWNHIVATFDGQDLKEWINGRQIGNRESRFKKYEPGANFMIGTRGRPDLAKYKGLVDKVRIYNRAMPEEEAIAHFKAEAGEYGFDPTWFSRVRVTPYYYFDRGEVVVMADYNGLQPLDAKARIDVTLAAKKKPKKAIMERAVATLPASGMAEVKFPTDKLVDGDYLIRVTLTDAKGARPVEAVEFSYPAKLAPVPSPVEKVAAHLTQGTRQAPFGVTVRPGGGFDVKINGATYPFNSRISWPNGRFNCLASADAPYEQGEKAWKTSVNDLGDGKYEVIGAGEFYSVKREIEVRQTHVYVKDTYSNSTGGDLGLLIYNETPVKPGQVTQSRLSGHDRWGRQPELTYPDYGPNVFFNDANTGMGIIPVDDVYFIQAVPYVDWEGAAGVGTEKFALAPGASYTLEWAVYPTASGDYYDYINAFRVAEDRIGTAIDAAGFVTYGAASHRQVPTRDYIEKRGLTAGITSCGTFSADDRGLSIEGIEFTDFPREMELLRDQATATHLRFPRFKLVFHIAHSLYCTDKPDRFADSKVIGADGKQATWGSEGNFSKARQDAGWRWYIYYPTPGNSFHDALLKSVDVIMDDLGFNGAFMDGFMAGYISAWTYDRWDGHSAEMDMNTKTIKRKLGSVILLSQPSMIAFARKIRDKGGLVIANNSVYTRTLCREKYILYDNECASGPEMHLAPTLTALRGSSGPAKDEQEVYLDMLDKLTWGECFMYYNERLTLTYPSLASMEYPITFEEVRSGMIKGHERIITMNSGVYGWPGGRQLHLIQKFDDRGAPTSNDFVTTADAAGVRSELKFAKNESAVIQPLPVTVETASPVNVRVLQYDVSSIRLLVNGQGEATVKAFMGGSYPDRNYEARCKDPYNLTGVEFGAPYRVNVGGAASVVQENDGVVAVPLKLNGQVEVSILPGY